MSVVVGILGAARIAPRAMIQPASKRRDTVIGAVGARSLERARDFAHRYGISRAYGSYHEVIADPDVTLVYCALPPSEHFTWSMAALKAGKHVLCEKPITMNADEAEILARAADGAGRQVIEAFHDRYHPAFRHFLQLVRAGRLGTVSHIRAEVMMKAKFDPDSFRYNPKMGGGALMEFGCYPIRWIRDLGGAQPRVVSASSIVNPLGADSTMRATFQFPGGAEGTILADGLADVPVVTSRISVVGSRGRADLEDSIASPADYRVSTWIDGAHETRAIGHCTSYDHQLSAVCTAIRTNSPAATSAHDFIPNMRLIDSVYRAANGGHEQEARV